MSTQSLGQGGGVSNAARARTTASIKEGARVEIDKELSAIARKRLTQEVGEVKEMLDEASKAEFEAWKKTFKKRYSSATEEATAFANFAENARLSKVMNAILKQPATKLSARSDQPVPRK